MTNSLRSLPWDDLVRSKALAACLGLCSHLVLSRGLWDQTSHLLFSGWVIAFGATATALYSLDPRVSTAWQVVQTVAPVAGCYFGTLCASILIYRAFFHRLGKFPGPFLARLSNFYAVSLAIPKSQYYNEIEKMHQKYKCDIIRTGPRELSIASADAIPLIHGPMTKCRKGPWYESTKHMEGYSLHTTPSKNDHKERRKAWDRALGAKSLRDYEPRINRHTRALIDKLKEHGHEPALRISNWLNFWSFDIMGDIGFNRSFGMLEKGKEDKMIAMLHGSMAPVSVLTHIPWALSGITRTSVAVKDMVEFISWTSDVLRERKKITPKENDVFSYLMNPDEEGIPMNLNADARLMIVAGSDTSAATLTWLCYELCKNPDAQTKFRNIIDEIALGKSFLDAEDLSNLPYLDGVINEALRLHPAVPSGVQRETPPEGIHLTDGTYIPGETIIWTPPHTLQRDPRYFIEPLSFMPERWTDEKPSYVVDKRAFIPFSTGSYNCVGQKLAVMEMRAVAANLVRSFEMEFGKGERGEACENETKDCFTLNVGKLDVKLTMRNVEKA